MRKLYVHSFKTRYGTIRTAATERGLAVVMLPRSTEHEFEQLVKKRFPADRVVAGGTVNLKAEKQLKKYLDGKLRRFDLKVDLSGTPFQKKVLSKVAAIPFGQTVTYGDIARAVGNPKAARAVGRVNATNLLPLVIPCHRVVASGGLGGYGGGLKLKKELLKLEGNL